LCISSTTITRILRVHFLITDSETILDSDIEAAVQQVNNRLAARQPSVAQLLAAGMIGDLPSSRSYGRKELNLINYCWFNQGRSLPAVAVICERCRKRSMRPQSRVFFEGSRSTFERLRVIFLKSRVLFERRNRNRECFSRDEVLSMDREALLSDDDDGAVANGLCERDHECF
jgi:hypothetical protein